MRLTAFRAWINHAASHSVGAARRVGKAMTKRMRAATGRIDAGVGVGDDESSFGGGRARVWFEEVLEETRIRLLNILERTVFERFPKIERLMRRVLGDRKPVRAPQIAPPKRVTGPLGVHVPKVDPEVERYRAQIQRDMLRAHTEEHAGLRDSMDRRRGRANTPAPGPEAPAPAPDATEDEPL